MRTATTDRSFRTAKRQEIIDVTEDVERCRAEGGHCRWHGAGDSKTG